MAFLDGIGDLFSNLPIVGGLFGDSTSSLSRDQQKRYSQLAQSYKDRLGPNREARMQALAQTMSLFQPMLDTLKRHSGQQYDFSKLLQDPMKNYEAGIQAEQTKRADALTDWSDPFHPVLSKNIRDKIAAQNKGSVPDQANRDAVSNDAQNKGSGPGLTDTQFKDIMIRILGYDPETRKQGK